MTASRISLSHPGFYHVKVDGPYFSQTLEVKSSGALSLHQPLPRTYLKIFRNTESDGFSYNGFCRLSK